MFSSLEWLDQFLPDFTWGHLSKGYCQFIEMVLHCWTKWLPCLYMVKNTWKSSPEPRKLWSWILVYWSWRQGLPSFLGSPLTFLQHGQICVLVAVAILEECCMASADMQWVFYSGERIVIHRPLVLFFQKWCFGHFFQFYKRNASMASWMIFMQKIYKLSLSWDFARVY